MNGFDNLAFCAFCASLHEMEKSMRQKKAKELLLAITSTFLGLFVAVSVSEVFEAQTLSNLFRFPMLFLCGLFIPIDNLPLILRPISYIIPLTYGADILKNAINGDGHIHLDISFFALISLGLLLFVYSIQNVKRKWII